MIEIIYAGYNTEHTSNFKYKDDDKHDWWLLIQTHTSAYFIIEKETCYMPPHSTILFPPHVSIEYGAYNNEPYSDDWIRFYTDEPYITKGTLPLQKPFKTLEHNYINHLFCMIAAENFFDNKFKEKTIQSLFTILIYKLTESYLSESCDFLTLSLNQLHLNIQNNPAFPWTISYMANQLHVCPRHLHKLYKSTFGTSCMDDVIIHRTLFAKDLLKTTNHSIQEIALKCGYGNSEHFSRQFKKIVGISPKSFRNTPT